MGWFNPKNKDKLQPGTDWNQEFLKLEGELDEETARRTLGKFLEHNFQFTVRIMTGMILKPFQSVLIKGWFIRNFSLACWGRSAAKTLCYNELSQVISQEHGLISLPKLLPNIDFSREGWVDIPEVKLWNGNGWQSTNKIYVQPQKHCLSVKTSRGYSVEGSINHLVKVLNADAMGIEWKRYSDIKLGDWVCISRNEADWGATSRSQKELDEAYLIGLLLGDGCLSPKSRVPIGKWTKKAKTTAVQTRFLARFYNDLLYRYDIKRSLSYTKQIPQKILEDKSMLKECLSGLFDTDGTVTKRGAISYCTVSEVMAKQVHNALLIFGIVSTKSIKKTPSKFGHCYQVSITGQDATLFKERIGFKLERKQARINLSVKTHTNKDIIPGAKKTVAAIRSGVSLPLVQSNIWRDKYKCTVSIKNLSYPAANQRIKFLQDCGVEKEKFAGIDAVMEEGFYFDPVTEIVPFDHDCIDFNVPDGEMYWSNGFISHNSTLAGIFSVLYGILNPGTTILIVSSNFRSSRRILEQLEMLAKRKPDGVLLRQVFESDLSRRNDIFKWTMYNGSTIVCLPLANGEGLRGQRANVLIVDEALLVSKNIIENILKPFLAASANITDRLNWREIEDKLIAKGLMREEDRKQFKSTSKMILLSSASFQGEYFHDVYVDYLKKISENEDSDSSYFVSQLSYEVIQELAPELLDKGILDDVNSGNTPRAVIDREYRAQFIQDSDGFFRAKHLNSCTIPPGEMPCVEIVGDPQAQYVLGIDPNQGGDETNDHFAMSLLKIIPKGDKKIGCLVHSYAAAGVDLEDHIRYIIYILQHFNVVYICVDTSHGDNMDFISVCNTSVPFKENNIKLDTIDADFGRVDYMEIAKEVRRKYNLNNKKIVHNQHFHTDFIGAANDYLQACTENGNIKFASKARDTDEDYNLAMHKQSVGNIHKTHKLFNEFKDGDPMSNFIEYQDNLIDLTKMEMASIQVSVTQLGTRQFQLPRHHRHTKTKNRVRKDNYSSILLSCWGLLIYLESQNVQMEQFSNTFLATLI